MEGGLKQKKGQQLQNARVCFYHSRRVILLAECDSHTHKCNLNTYECDYDTIEWDFHTQSVLSNYDYDNGTHECNNGTHECDLYTHSVISLMFTRTNVSLICTRRV
jgi:hypothetical protein